MLLYLDDRFADHNTGAHPEQPERILRINRMLRQTGWLDRTKQPSWEAISDEALARVHGRDYLERLDRFCQRGGGRIESDTVVSQASYEVARRAAGAAIDAVDRVVQGDEHRAFCAIRPPGHHALVDAPMGFCLMNNISLAAKHAIAKHRLDRVLVIDFDVHHGNGTQDIFYSDPSVLFLSIHRFPFYPGTGEANETGTGKGIGTKYNIPIQYGTQLDIIVESFERGCQFLADRFQPQLILLSAGFDAHRADPIGDLGLEQEDYERLTKIVVKTAQATCDGRIVSLLEGGYHLDWLPRCVSTHLEALQ